MALASSFVVSKGLWPCDVSLESTKMSAPSMTELEMSVSSSREGMVSAFVQDSSNCCCRKTGTDSSLDF